MMQVPNEISVGIDLGTMYSTIYIEYNDNECGPTPITDSNGLTTIPSIVYFGKKTIIVGKDATYYPTTRCIIDNKRFLGRKWSEIVGKIQIKHYNFLIKEGAYDDILYQINATNDLPMVITTPLEVAVEMFKYFKSIIEMHIGQNTRINCTIGVPAYFNSNQREATVTAAKDAGFISTKIISEATAAIIGHFFVNKKEMERKNNDNDIINETWIIVNAGAGTTDFSKIRVKGVQCGVQDNLTWNWRFENLKITGCGFVGGRYYNVKMQDLLMEKLKSNRINVEMFDSFTLSKLYNLSENMKIELSNQSCIEKCFKYNDIIHKFKITRKQFEAVIENSITEMHSNLIKCICNKKKKKKRDKLIGIAIEKQNTNKYDKIDKVIIMGGSGCQHIINTVKSILPDTIIETVKMESQLISIGATYASSVRTNKYNNIMWRDISSHTIGVATDKQKVFPLIPAGSSLPFAYTYTELTNSGTEKVDCVIYEGNSKNVRNNIEVAEAILIFEHQQEPGTVGLLLQVHLDVNGCLEIKLKCENNMNEIATITKDQITNNTNDKWGLYDCENDSIDIWKLKKNHKNILLPFKGIGVTTSKKYEFDELKVRMRSEYLQDDTLLPRKKKIRLTKLNSV